MLEHEIILHIGMPKTGTTSLQKFLANNNAILMGNGFCYPNSRMNFDNQNVTTEERWVNGGLRPYTSYVLEHDAVWKEAFMAFLDIVTKSLKDYNVILSDEAVWNLHDEEKKYLNFLKKYFGSVRIVVCLRRQDFHMESGRRQNIKRRLNNETEKIYDLTLPEFYKINLNKEFYCYYEKIQSIERLVGEENLEVYLYEDAKAHGIYGHFIESLGLDLIHFKSVESENVSQSVMDAEIKRHLNAAMSDQCIDVRKKIEEEYWKKGMFFSSERGYQLKPWERKEILNSYAENNKKTAKRYFHREQLFNEKVDYPYVEYTENEIQKNYAALLEELLKSFAQKESRLKIFLKKLSQRKKLAFLGAGRRCRFLMEREGWKPDLILDNDSSKEGEFIDTVEIECVDRFSDWDDYVCLITVQDSLEICGQLISYALKKDEDFFDSNEIGL